MSYMTMLWQHDAYEDPRQCNTVPRILIITNGALSYKAAHTAAMMAEADVYATHYVSLSSIGPMKSTWKLGCGCFCADPIQRSITIIPTLHSMLWICIFIRPRTVDSNRHLTKHWQDKSLGGEQWWLQQKNKKMNQNNNQKEACRLARDDSGYNKAASGDLSELQQSTNSSISKEVAQWAASALPCFTRWVLPAMKTLD